MAVTAALIQTGRNRLRYLITDDGGGGTSVILTTTGAATPDIKTDSLQGPIKKCALAFVNGLGKLPAGAMTQAQSRAIWEANNSDTVLGNGKVPRALCRLQVRSGGQLWFVDANVDGSGHPTIVISRSAAAAGTAYLDIETQGGVGI